jgi:DNA-binding protein YbaB
LKRVEPKQDNNDEIKKNIMNFTKRLSEMQEEMSKMQDFLKSLT